MGNALSFKSIFDDIAADQQNNYLTDIAYQYGRLIRIIFDFSPLTSSSLTDKYIIKTAVHALRSQ